MRTHKQDRSWWAKTTMGDRLRYALEVRGLTQTSLARRAGVTQPCIANILSGTRGGCRATTLMAISRELNIPAEWLGEGRGDLFARQSVVNCEELEISAVWSRLGAKPRRALLDLANAMTR